MSAYAAGGDKNALARGLVDFGLLTALSAGFEEGGFTGEGGKSDIAGHVHKGEYVVTAADTKRFNLVGKSGDEFGEAVSDYFAPQSPIQQNPYKAQKEAFKQDVKVKTNDNQVIKELQSIKNQLASQPNYSAQIVEVQEGLYEWVLRREKQNMTHVNKKILRAANK